MGPKRSYERRKMIRVGSALEWRRNRLTTPCLHAGWPSMTMVSSCVSFMLSRGVLYRVPEIVTLGRLPGEGESDSRWRTKEVRHVGSDTLTPGF